MDATFWGQDPATLVCPDFTTDEHEPAREDFGGQDCDHALAASILAKAWRANNKTEVARWNLGRQEAAARAAETLTRQAEDKSRCEQLAALHKEEVQKEEMKKNRLKHIPIPLRLPPERNADIMAVYARRKLEKALYLDLWYATNEGLVAARKAGASVEEEAMLLIMDPVTGDTSWIPAAAKWDPLSFRKDEDLSWDELSVAFPRMIVAMQQSNWPAQKVDMLASFWGALMSHEYRMSTDPLDVRTLIVYQAEQRQYWHQAWDAPGGAWDISIISDVLLGKMRERVYGENRLRLDKEHR